MLHDLGKPIRTILRWQWLATAALTLAAGIWGGAHGALSASLGGLISIIAGWASGIIAALGKAESTGEVLFTALRAEVVKIGLIVILLWLVLTMYGSVVVPAFLGTFVATAVIFSMAFFVREHK
jgi:ATP synthase protein I